jgi:hypothetical protein
LFGGDIGEELGDDIARNLDEAGDGSYGGGSCPIKNSFSADTTVATANGDVPISQIVVGDKVLAFNEATGKTGEYAVTATMDHIDPVIVHLTIDGERIETTPEHPFYTQERGWVDAGELQVGEHIHTADWDFGTVESVETLQQTQVMYNLTVDEAHTFFVGDGQWLVHNACRLEYLGDNTWKSEEGLIYADDWHNPKTGSVTNRVQHVMRHASDDVTRNAHGVFSAPRDEVLELVDEAFLRAGDINNVRDAVVSSRLVTDPLTGNRVKAIEYDVNMGRNIGYQGGINGASLGNPVVDHIRLILTSGNRVITAFPVP